MKISFDIDGTLDNKQIQVLFWNFYLSNSRGAWVSLNILSYKYDTPEERKSNYCVVCSGVFLLGDTTKTKLEVIIEENIDIHFDDNEFEVAQINNYAKEHNLNLTAVLVNYNGKVDDN